MRMIFLPAVLWFATFMNAQTQPSQITGPVTKSVVKHLIANLDEYVFPDRAREVQSYLIQHEAEYEGLTNPRALAEKLTADMRQVGHDQHLTVSYTDFLPAEEQGSRDSREQSHMIEEASGLGIRTVARLPGNIGLLDLAYFSDDPEAAAALDGAMTMLHGADAVIVDLRRNMGGNPIMVRQLLTYLFQIPVELTSFHWRVGAKERIDEQWTLPFVPGTRISETPIFVLTSHETFSAAEQCAYDLKVLHRATLVGETTRGGANPAASTRSLGLYFEAFIPTGRAVNPITRTNWEGVGVQPDVITNAPAALVEAYQRALRAARPSVKAEHLMSARQKALSNPARTLRDEGFKVD